MTPQQDQAVACIASGMKYVAVAAEIGVHEGSIKRWATKPAFKEALQRAKDAVSGTPSQPTDVLRAALGAKDRNGGPDWQVRVSAARALIALEGGKPPPKANRSAGIILDEQVLGPPGARARADRVEHRARGRGLRLRHPARQRLRG